MSALMTCSSAQSKPQQESLCSVLGEDITCHIHVSCTARLPESEGQTAGPT